MHRALGPYLLASWREGRGEAPLPAVPPGAQQTLLDAHPLPRPLHQPLALPQPLQALLVLPQLLLQLPAAPQQQLLLRLALALPRLQPALLGLLLPLLLVTRAVPASLLLLELVLELVEVSQLLTLLLQGAGLLVLQGATSEGGTGGQALLLLQNQLVDLDVAVLDGQGSLGGGRGQVNKSGLMLWFGL